MLPYLKFGSVRFGSVRFEAYFFPNFNRIDSGIFDFLPNREPNRCRTAVRFRGGSVRGLNPVQVGSEPNLQQLDLGRSKISESIFKVQPVQTGEIVQRSIWGDDTVGIRSRWLNKHATRRVLEGVDLQISRGAVDYNVRLSGSQITGSWLSLVCQI